MRKTFLYLSAALSLTVLAFLAWGWLTEGDAPEDTAGAAMVSVTVLELSGAALQGEALFQASCATCHGDNAAGREGIGPPLIHKIYEPGHHGDGAFYLAVKQGARAHHWPFGNMPPVEDVTQKDVESIVAYVRKLQRANGIN